MADFLTAQVSIRANIERLKVDLAAAKKEVYRAVDELSARAAKGDVDKLAKRPALITTRGIKDQIKAENDLLRGLRTREVQNNRLAREHRRAVNEMVEDLKRFSRQSLITGLAVTAGMTYAVKKYADAERAMRRALATSDTAPSEAAFSRLSKSAEDYSIRLNMSINEIASSLNILKLSGMSLEQQLEVLPSLLTLAKGSVTDAGMVTDKLLDLMKAFNIEEIRLSNISNTLAYASTHARTSLTDLMDALKAASTIAQMTGNSFEQMTAIMMFMADAGIKGSQAGMALRRTLFNLGNESSKARKALGEYIDVYDTSTGKMKPFYQILNELTVALQNVNDKTRDSVLLKLFEQRAVTGGLAVFRAGSKGLLEYENRVKNAGTAVQNLADYQLKALSEQLGILWQQVQTVVRKIGQGLVPVITNINIVIRPYLNALREWMDLNPKLIQSLVSMVASLAIGLVVVGGLGIAIRALGPVIGMLKGAVVLLGPALIKAFSGPLGIVLALGGAFYVLRTAYNANLGGMQEILGGFVNSVKAGVDWMANNIWTPYFSWLTSTYTELFSFIANTFLEVLAKPTSLITATYYKLRYGLDFSEIYAETHKAITDSAKGLFTIKGLTTGVYSVIKATGSQIKDDIASMMGILIIKFPEYTTLLRKFQNEIIEGVGVGIPADSILYLGGEKALSNWEKGIQKYYESINNWNTFVQDSVKNTAISMENSFANTFATIGDEGKNFKNIMNDIFRSIGEELRRLMGQLASRMLMKATIEMVFPKLTGLGDGSEKLGLAASMLQTAGSVLDMAGAALSAAAAQLSAAAGISTGGGDFLTTFFGGGGGGGEGTWAGTNTAPGFGTTPTPTGTFYAHSGGIIGSNLVPNMLAPSSLFANVPRFHNGLKLRSDEFPAILERGEEVRSKRDANKDREDFRTPTINDNRLKIVNVLDPSLLKDYLRTSDGEKLVLNIINRNPNTVRS